jgi:hypothetical protein
MFRPMTKIVTGLVSAMLILGGSAAAQAYTIYLSDIAPTSAAPAVAAPITADVGTSGTLYIYENGDPENYDFANGTLGVSLSSSNDSVIKFTSATVYTPEFFGGFVKRWAGTQVQLAANGTDIEILKGVSVSTAGLINPAAPTNGQPNTDANNSGSNYAFAEIHYEVIGAGTTTLQLGVITAQPGQFLVDGGINVAGEATFGSATIVGLPEPSTLGLFALGITTALRRKRR